MPMSMPRARVRVGYVHSGSKFKLPWTEYVRVDRFKTGAVPFEFGGDGGSCPFATRPNPLVTGDGEDVGAFALPEVLLLYPSVGARW